MVDNPKYLTIKTVNKLLINRFNNEFPVTWNKNKFLILYP